MAGRTELEALYRARYQAFRRVALAVLGNQVPADEAVHGGFVRALRDARTFRGEGPLEAWVEARRRRDREARALRPSDTRFLGHAGLAGGDGDHGLVRALPAALPERQSLVLFLHYSAGPTTRRSCRPPNAPSANSRR